MIQGTTASNAGDTTISAGVRSVVAIPYQSFGGLSLSGSSQDISPTNSLATGSPKAATAKGQAPVTFTAYDPNGRPHTQQRVPSDTTSQTSNATVIPARKNNWAKPTGSRNATPMFTTPTAIRPRYGYESSSEDEM